MNASLTPGSSLLRFFASILDNFILIAVTAPFLLLFSGTPVAIILSFAVSVGYHTWFHASAEQATPGERIFKIYVVTRSGGRLSMRRAFERTLGYFLPFLPQYASVPDDAAASLILFLVFCWFAPILLTRNATGLHDVLCDTRVVAGRVA